MNENAPTYTDIAAKVTADLRRAAPLVTLRKPVVGHGLTKALDFAERKIEDRRLKERAGL